MTGDRTLTLTVAATFTAEPVEATLRYWSDKLQRAGRIEFAPYDQVFQQLLDPSGPFYASGPGLNVILLRLEDWMTAGGTAADDLERSTSEFIGTLKATAGRLQRSILVIVCPSSPEVEERSDALLRAAEARLDAELAGLTGVHVLPRRTLMEWYPIEHYHHASGARLGHAPYTPVFYAALGTTITRAYQALGHTPRKVVVLDCDMTLWKGICGEDGPEGVEIDEPSAALQRFMVQRHDAGMLLCLCSKNDEADVRDTFAYHGDMPLSMRHVVAHRINWKSKPENLRSLAEELRLGLDSFIFVDDNSIECAEVEAACPEVLAVRLPTDRSTLPQFLNHVWAFDRPPVTELDRRRTELYRAESNRDRAIAASRTLAEFIEGLELQVSFSPLSRHHLDRAAQLTFRTNQLNLTTIRRSGVDLRTLCEAGGHECQVVDVSDRFGDYGTVGVPALP